MERKGRMTVLEKIAAMLLAIAILPVGAFACTAIYVGSALTEDGSTIFARLEEFSSRFPVTRIILPLSGSKREKDISDFFHLDNTSEAFSLLLQKSITNR